MVVQRLKLGIIGIIVKHISNYYLHAESKTFDSFYFNIEIKHLFVYNIVGDEDGKNICLY